MKKRNLFLVVVLLLTTTMFAQTPILGEWITVDDSTGEQKSIVSIYQADNGKYYGESECSQNTKYFVEENWMKMLTFE